MAAAVSAARGRESFTLDRAVDFADVESSLRALWRRAAEHGNERAHPPAVRVTTLNLVVLAASRADADDAHALALELCARRPGRVLIVQAEAGNDGVRAEVATECYRVGGNREVCSETVRIHAGGRSILFASQLVAPLLVADVPVVLWLPRHPTLLPVDDDLLALADRLVVDAHHFTDAAGALRQLSDWWERRRQVVDLAWLRLERWRGLTASMLPPPAEGAVPERIEVTYRGAEDSPDGRVEALYYVSWIANAHGMRLGRGISAGAEEGCWTVRERDREAALRLCRVARAAGDCGDLVSVSLRSAEGSEYEIRRLPGTAVAELTVRDREAAPGPLHVAMPSPSPIDLLARAVGPQEDDEVYRAVLAGALALADAR